ncbi:tail assembly protein [Stenotrophomonas phage vB_SmaS_DLP_3]|nr:tail assembly protein [Stenotrophomonas phage vB_SmaS_DLP_3]
MAVVVAQRMWQRRDTAANWASINPVMAAGEIGVELGATEADPQKFKIGNGKSPWNTLKYGAADDLLKAYQDAEVITTVVGTEKVMILKDGGLKVIAAQALTGGGGGDGQVAVEMQVAGGYLQYRNIGETTWYNLVLLSALNQGSDVRMRQNSGYLQYSNDAGLTWNNLVTVESLRGPQGVIGPNGLDAYQVAVAQGFAGTRPQWLASLKGEKGDQGVQGPPGIPSQRRIQQIDDTNSGSVTCDWNAYDEIRITLTTDTTLNFVGALDGQGCVVKIRQDAVGNHDVSFSSNVRFNTLIPSYNPTVTPMKADRLGFVYDLGDGAYDFHAIVNGI